MGLIKNVIGALLGFIQTLLSGLLGVFGLGKKSEYFLEIDEASDSVVSPAPESVAPSPAEVPVTPAPAQPAAAAKAPEQVAQPTVAPVATTVATTPTQSKGSADGEMTFATDFLVNPRLTNTSRRRPGPSLSPFTDMVKDMKRSASMG